MKNEIIVKANMANVPADMRKASENLQNVLNNMNASKKQLAKASYELKVQAEESKVTFKDFIKEHFSMFDISDSRLYALAQTAETFSNDEFKKLWERIPVSKLEKMCRIKKAKTNKNVGAFGYIPFLQCVSFRAIEQHNFACENSAKLLVELKRKYAIAKEEDRLEDALKINNQISQVENTPLIEIPENEDEQKAFYLNDGISRVCAMTDVKVGELVKLYNMYSDIIAPEKDETDGNSDSNSDNNSKDNDSKEKTVPEMIACILAEVQTLRDKAKTENIELPDSTIQAFVECMENFGK